MFTDIVYAMGGAPQNAGASGQGGSPFSFIIMMAAIFVIFYFLMIRPQSKKAKEHKIMLDNLKKGDKIIISAIVPVITLRGIIHTIFCNRVRPMQFFLPMAIMIHFRCGICRMLKVCAAMSAL